MADTNQESVFFNLPMLPLRDVVVYPHMVLPLFVGRAKSIAALDAAMENDEPVFLLAQKNPNNEDPGAEDLYRIGTLANVLQVLKLPDGTVKVLVEGTRRAEVVEVDDSGDYFTVAARPLAEDEGAGSDAEGGRPVSNTCWRMHSRGDGRFTCTGPRATPTPSSSATWPCCWACAAPSGLCTPAQPPPRPSWAGWAWRWA